jgi:hypothetical protein
MASIRYSATGGEIKGKINGTVYQGGKSGPIVKRLIHRSFVRLLGLVYGMFGSGFVFPNCIAESTAGGIRCQVYNDGSHKPNLSFARQQVKMASIASGWRLLSSVQRVAWNASAVNFPFRNKFGDLYTGSGFQVYQMLNLNLLSINQPLITFPPAPAAPVLPTIEDPATTGADALQYNFPDGIPAGQSIMVYSSIGQSAGLGSSAKNLKLIAVLGETVGATSFNLRYMWQIFFGMLQANTAIQIKFVPVNTSTGEAGSETSTSELIDAIAAGAKLTKADANIVMPPDVHTNPVTATTSFFAYNWGTKARLLLTGANAAELEISIDGGANYGNPADVFTNAWDNIPPTEVIIRSNWASAGSKIAYLEYQTAAGVMVTFATITGNPT